MEIIGISFRTLKSKSMGIFYGMAVPLVKAKAGCRKARFKTRERPVFSLTSTAIRFKKTHLF